MNFSPQTVPGLDTNALEQQIYSRIRSAGLVIDNQAPTTLFIQINYQRLPACPEFLLVQTHIALSEDAKVKRGRRTETVWVDTYSEDEDFVEPANNAAAVASASSLALLEHLLDARKYTQSVVRKRK